MITEQLIDELFEHIELLQQHAKLAKTANHWQLPRTVLIAVKECRKTIRRLQWTLTKLEQ